LVFIEKNGNKTYSNTVVANSDCVDNGSLRIFPNPVAQWKMLTIEYTSRLADQMGSLSLYDTNGQLLSSKKVMVKNGFNSFQFSLGQFASTSYFIRVATDDKMVNILKPIAKGGK